MDEEIKPSAWETPENVGKIIEALPGIVASLMENTKATNEAAANAAQVMHNRVAIVGYIVAGGAVASALLAIWIGHPDVAEKVLIPLISFAGDIGLGTRLNK